MQREDLINAPPATGELANFAAGLKFEMLPGEVVEHAKLCVLDALGCTLFGNTLPWTRMIADMAITEGANEEALIWNTAQRTSPALAALVNGTGGHGFELDDLHTAGMLHVSTLSVPAAIALAEARGPVNGRDFLVAVIAGFEIGLRIGMASTHSLFHRGWHPQGNAGVMAAAATAACILNLSKEKTLHAIALAASQAAGLMAAQEGAMAKRFHGGRATQSGVYAALLAERGFTGIPNAIEAPYGGFLSSFTDKCDPKLLTHGLSQIWETMAIGFKPNPTVSCIQAPIKALREIMATEKLVGTEIDRIEVSCSTFTYRHTVWDYKAESVTEAQMNLGYGLAVTAIDGDAFVEQYHPERIVDPAIREFSKRIHARIEPNIDAEGPALRDHIELTLFTKDDRQFSRELLYRPGSPEDPMAPAELERKFRRLCKASGTSVDVEGIIQTVTRLDALTDIGILTELLENRSSK